LLDHTSFHLHHWSLKRHLLSIITSFFSCFSVGFWEIKPT
jgi:hypothetical protein